MGFIRGAVITVFGLVLSITLLLMVFSVVVASTLEYEDIKPAMKETIYGIMDNYLVESEFENHEDYCSVDKEYILFLTTNNSISIPCETIEQGKEATINYVSENLADELYYTNYNCEFWECVKTSQGFALISEKARLYWIGKTILLALMSLILFFLIILIAEKRPSKFISLGFLIALCSLPFFNLYWILKLVPVQFSAIFSLLSLKAHKVFIIMIILAAIFILFGTVSKIFGWKMRIFENEEPETKTNIFKEKGLSKSDVREIVKEEISKSKPDKQKKQNKNIKVNKKSKSNKIL